MLKYCFSLLLFFVSCNIINKKELRIFYFYDQQRSYEFSTWEKDSLTARCYHWTRDTIVKDLYGDDRYSMKSYYLCNCFYIGKSLKEDTFFIKGYRYLDSIRYFDSAWLSKEENLDEFWEFNKPKAHPYDDSMMIYFVEQYKNTDSLIFRRVHRSFDMTD